MTVNVVSVTIELAPSLNLISTHWLGSMTTLAEITIGAYILSCSLHSFNQAGVPIL